MQIAIKIFIIINLQILQNYCIISSGGKMAFEEREKNERRRIKRTLCRRYCCLSGTAKQKKDPEDSGPEVI